MFLSPPAPKEASRNNQFVKYFLCGIIFMFLMLSFFSDVKLPSRVQFDAGCIAVDSSCHPSSCRERGDHLGSILCVDILLFLHGIQ